MLVFQWNGERNALRWKLLCTWRSLLQRSGIRPEARGRNAPEFLGTRVPRARIASMLEDAGLELRHTAGDGTLYRWAWAVGR